jgi:hypothetical protein
MLMNMNDIFSQDDLGVWIHKYLIVKSIRNTSQWVPDPPVAFLWDITKQLHINLYDTTKRTSSLYKIMKRCPDETTVATFLKVVRQKITKKLVIAKAAFPNNSVWDALSLHFKHHPETLYM